MRNIELLYLAAAYGMGAILFAINRDGRHQTTSEIAAGRKLGRHVFFWGLLVSGVLYGVLMYKWLIPHFELTTSFKVLTGVLIGFQILTGIIPARGKKVGLAHLAAAFSLGACMLITVLWLAFVPSVRGPVRIIEALLAVAMIALITTPTRWSSTSYIKRQNIFFGCWHAAILLVVYLG